MSRALLLLGPNSKITAIEKERRRKLNLYDYDGKHPANVTYRGLYKKDLAIAITKAKAASGTGIVLTMLF